MRDRRKQKRGTCQKRSFQHLQNPKRLFSFSSLFLAPVLSGAIDPTHQPRQIYDV
ncbi:Uncharacterized protein APZ42_021888 [Daphnia magna]|uniref:Uncharacterized protein n=1 Tax=Daphnia magna TaxID=35525 RepID=A0A164W955_9CRUS|nr:Uncharacterized protein APZ42_021888 [Daphnia magna]